MGPFLRPMVILTKCVLINSFIAIALVFGILNVKFVTNTNLHYKPLVFGVLAK